LPEVTRADEHYPERENYDGNNGPRLFHYSLSVFHNRFWEKLGYFESELDPDLIAEMCRGLPGHVSESQARRRATLRLVREILFAVQGLDPFVHALVVSCFSVHLPRANWGPTRSSNSGFQAQSLPLTGTEKGRPIDEETMDKRPD
jgi:hypothetical protein